MSGLGFEIIIQDLKISVTCEIQLANFYDVCKLHDLTYKSRSSPSHLMHENILGDSYEPHRNVK